MSSFKKPSISLSLNKRARHAEASIADVFGDDDSDDEQPQVSAAQRFDGKYAGSKARDERAVAKVLAENPDAYEYDSYYDELEQKRELVRQEEEKEKAERKPKYIDKFQDAKKKREMEHVLRDQRKQQKERDAEGDEFKDKEVFVTSSYRKQLEEANKVMKELNAAELIPEPQSVVKPLTTKQKVQYIAPETGSERRKTHREIEREEREARMTKVREILRRRNTDEDIEAARERYLERRREGLITI